MSVSIKDTKLVQKVLQGNIKSFEIIVNRYEMRILKFAYSMLKNKEAAEDITQEVFITVYNKLDTFDSKYKFSNWILRITKNKCIDYIRKHKKINEYNIEEVNGVTSKESSPEESIEFKETKKEIERYINNLEYVDRQIVLLRYLQNVTFNEISSILDMSESSVKRRYYKVRNGFKEYVSLCEGRCSCQ